MQRYLNPTVQGAYASEQSRQALFSAVPVSLPLWYRGRSRCSATSWALSLALQMSRLNK